MDNKKLNVLLITGIVTNEHDPRVTPMIRFALESTKRFNVKVTEEFKGATAETLEGYDLVFINFDGKPSIAEPYIGIGATSEKVIYDFVKGGGGAVLYHSSFIHGDPAYPDEFDHLVGAHFEMSEMKGRKSPRNDGYVDIVKGAHKITEGFPDRFCIQMDDLFFNPEWLPDVPVTVLATMYDSFEDYLDLNKMQPHMRVFYEGVTKDKLPGVDTDQPVCWIHEYGKGRVFTVSLGHGPDTLRSIPFVAMLLRGTEWAASGEVTIPYPDLENERRTQAWPYFLDMTVQEYARFTSF